MRSHAHVAADGGDCGGVPRAADYDCDYAGDDDDDDTGCDGVPSWKARESASSHPRCHCYRYVHPLGAKTK